MEFFFRLVFLGKSFRAWSSLVFWSVPFLFLGFFLHPLHLPFFLIVILDPVFFLAAFLGDLGSEWEPEYCLLMQEAGGGGRDLGRKLASRARGCRVYPENPRGQMGYQDKREAHTGIADPKKADLNELDDSGKRHAVDRWYLCAKKWCCEKKCKTTDECSQEAIREGHYQDVGHTSSSASQKKRVVFTNTNEEGKTFANKRIRNQIPMFLKFIIWVSITEVKILWAMSMK